MNDNLNLIYFSPTDTTKKVTRKIAEGINKNFKEYDSTLPINRKNPLNFNSKDLVIVGVPVYAGRVPSLLLDYFSKIKGENTKCIFVVVYGNRDYDDALLELKDIFESNGFLGIAAGAFIGEHSYSNKIAYNRPDSKDLELALNFGLDIQEKLSSGYFEQKDFSLNVKGNYPYKAKIQKPPMAPKTIDTCIECGICSKYCPTSAIDFDDMKEADPLKCIHCFSCVKRCPVNAKYIDHEIIINFTNNLINNCSTPKEPELFI